MIVTGIMNPETWDCTATTFKGQFGKEAEDLTTEELLNILNKSHVYGCDINLIPTAVLGGLSDNDVDSNLLDDAIEYGDMKLIKLLHNQGLITPKLMGEINILHILKCMCMTSLYRYTDSESESAGINSSYQTFRAIKLLFSYGLLTSKLISANDNEILCYTIKEGESVQLIKFFINALSDEDLCKNGKVLNTACAKINSLCMNLDEEEYVEIIETLLARSTLDDIRAGGNISFQEVCYSGDPHLVQLFLDKGITAEDIRSNRSQALKYAGENKNGIVTAMLMHVLGFATSGMLLAHSK
jgi:hypothetical protein